METGHATCKISVNRRGKETIVWCLAVLSDSTVVSGDSSGRLTFWDSNLGDQVIIFFCFFYIKIGYVMIYQLYLPGTVVHFDLSGSFQVPTMGHFRICWLGIW